MYPGGCGVPSSEYWGGCDSGGAPSREFALEGLLELDIETREVSRGVSNKHVSRKKSYRRDMEESKGETLEPDQQVMGAGGMCYDAELWGSHWL